MSDPLEDVIEGLRAFLRTEVISRHATHPELSDAKYLYGEDGRFRPALLAEMLDVRRRAAEAGYYTMLAPKELGGGGLGHEALFRAWHAIYRDCGALHHLGYWSVAHWARGPSQVLMTASDRVKAELLPRLLAGEATMCFAMSEPDAGSDAWTMRTTAERADGGWRLNGTKQWITNGPYADVAVVFAVTDVDRARTRRGGIGAFLVPTDSPGFRVDSVIGMFGHHGGDEGILSFSDVHVADDHLLGDGDDGMRIAMSGVSSGRLYNTARSVGLAGWAVAQALEYAQQRQAFGSKLIDFQAISHTLASAVIELQAARLLGLDTARRLDRGESGRAELAMSKVFATEMAVRAIDAAVQAHGAMGFTNELGLSDAWQQVRRIRVADGSAEVLRDQVVKSIRRGELLV